MLRAVSLFAFLLHAEAGLISHAPKVKHRVPSAVRANHTAQAKQLHSSSAHMTAAVANLANLVDQAKADHHQAADSADTGVHTGHVTKEQVLRERKLWMKNHPKPTKSSSSSHHLRHRHEKEHKATDRKLATKSGHNFVAKSRDTPDDEEEDGGIMDVVNDVTKVVDDLGQEVVRTGERTVMSSINIFRAQMCTLRPNVLEHVKCLKFMTKHCKTETTGHGYCKAYIELLEKGCPKHEDDNKHTRAACDYCLAEGCTYYYEKKEVEAEPIEELPAATTAAPTEAPEMQESEVDKMEVVPEEKVEKIETKKAPAPAPTPPKQPEASPKPPKLPKAAPPATPKTQPEEPPLKVATTEPAAKGSLGVDKKNKGLPPQGYDDWGHPLVKHVDGETHTKDWRKEWPHLPKETDEETLMRICKENKHHAWCKGYIKHPPAA